MKTAFLRAVLVALGVTLLPSCGGGGGGDGGGGTDPVPRLTLSGVNVTAQATPGELAPSDAVTLNVSDPPAAGLYLEAGYSTSGLERIEFIATSETSGEIQLFFRGPGSLNNGTYQDSIEVKVCTDQACRDQISGSPRTIAVSYEITGDGLTAGSFSTMELAVAADQRDDENPVASTTLTLSNLPPSGITLRRTENAVSIQSVNSIGIDLVRQFDVWFTPPNKLAAREHVEGFTLEFCYDESCVRQVRGSPFNFTTRYNVTVGLEPGYSTLGILQRAALAHDVVDAEYSKALGAIVMVGAVPENALYLYDVTNGVESKQPLDKPPTAVSVSADGLTAAVGHDRFVSIVDLGAVGSGAVPVLLDTGENVVDLVLDSTGHVLAMPDYEGEALHVIDIATNTEQTWPTPWYEHIKLHAATNRIYAATSSVASSVDVFDISTGAVEWINSWRYYGDHDACLDLWFSDPGDTMYTACGQTFRMDPDPAEDMVYAGTLQLDGAGSYSENGIRWLSHDPATHELALVESRYFDCLPAVSQAPCYTRLSYHEDQLLNRLAVYGIGPIPIDGTNYAQIGRFVFHGPDGARWLISELENPPEEDQRFWISVVEGPP
jgi:hypothetical protein